MSNIKFKIPKTIEDLTGDMIEDLSALIRIPSVRGEAEEGYPFGKEPARALEKMLELAKRLGFSVRNVDNYVGIIDFYPKREPTLGILCHLDVVPEGNGWHTPPYEMTLKDGNLYGRGVIDDKGPAISVLYAMFALKKLGVNLKENVRFIVGTDEECGSSDLAYYMKKEKLPTRLFTPDGSYPIINLEKGQVRITFEKKFTSTGTKTIKNVVGGTVTNAVPEMCEATVSGFSIPELKAVSSKVDTETTFEFTANGDDVRIVCTGKSAHASQPETGKNAVTSMLKLLGSLDTDDATGKSFKDMSEVFVYGETDGTSLGVKMSDDKSGALTFVHSINKYDGEKYTGRIDIRFPICSNTKEVREKLETAFKPVEIEISEFTGVEPHYVDENSDFIQTLLRVYEDVSGRKGSCIAIGGGTYVHETEGGVAFGGEFIGDDNHMHGADEKMSLDLFKFNARMYAEAILALCGEVELN
ncbi:MAG: dipeptidase PepV [Clostridia bacterium]|nr:dipeptidase PepV [Clostridia bacterium]